MHRKPLAGSRIVTATIELYTFATPNGKKPAIALEEMQLPYTVRKINIAQGEQHSPEYLAINPNGKIPAIRDLETGTVVFESGAILLYLAEKTGKLIPSDRDGRMQVIQWLMFQMAGVGPMFGQLGHFRNAAPEAIPYAIERYEKEALRLCAVLDKQLSDRDYIAGDYSIADIATYPWVAAYNYLKITLDSYPHLQRWLGTLDQRPAIQTGMALLSPS